MAHARKGHLMNLNDKYKYAKAAAAAVAAGLAALVTALADGAVSPAEWASIALATVIGSGLVAAAPRNKYPEL